VRTSSVAVRITGWYDWLLVVLALAFGAYTYECLNYCLSVGVQHALSIRAKEIGSVLAKTGQIPFSQVPYAPGFNDPFISVHESGGSVRDLSAKPAGHTVAPIDVRRPMGGVRRMANGAPLFIATVPLTIGNQGYVVEVGAPKRPVKAVLHGTARSLLIGLVVGLALATWGSCILVKRALVPVRKIFLAVQALPVTHPDERIQSVAVLDEIASLCITVNDLVGQLQESFQIGANLSTEDILEPGIRLGTLRAELVPLFEHKRLSIGVAKHLLCLLKETERLGDIALNLSMPSSEDARPLRTERLRFYFGGLAAAGLQHVCILTTQLGADLAGDARDPSDENLQVRW
jgi:hypothetical protein